MIKWSFTAAPATDPTTAWSAPATTGAETARATQVTASALTSKCASAASIWTHGPHLQPPLENSHPHHIVKIARTTYMHTYIYTFNIDKYIRTHMNNT